MPDFEDKVADAVFNAHDLLPGKFKPYVPCGAPVAWVILAGIVAVDEHGTIEVVSIASGMKCLPEQAIPAANGITLHDSHAEILAIRSLNHLLLVECQKLASAKKDGTAYNSPFVRWRSVDERTSTCPQAFAIHDKWQLWMYCSEAPCGDASMELVMAKQDDPTPWILDSSPGHGSPKADGSGLMGRGYFSELGAVRRKPARGDAPMTLSKSCTDKLALKQCTSLLSALTSLLVAPENAYLHTLVLPASQYVPKASERAFGPEGRMAATAGVAWGGGFAYRPLTVHTTNREFKYSRRAPVDLPLRASPDSKPWGSATASNTHAAEVIITGMLQGWKKGNPRGASVLSRRRMFSVLQETIELMEDNDLRQLLAQAKLYSDIKENKTLRARKQIKDDVVKAALKEWVPNIKDDFELLAHRAGGV